MSSIKPKKQAIKEKADDARINRNVGEAESEWRDKMQGKTALERKAKKIEDAGANAGKLPGTGFMADSKMMSNRYKRSDKKRHEGR